jgi:hypothetical protein
MTCLPVIPERQQHPFQVMLSIEDVKSGNALTEHMIDFTYS